MHCLQHSALASTHHLRDLRVVSLVGSVVQLRFATMAQFFDYRVSGGTGGETLTSAWCTAEPVLAVASTHNAIQLFSDEVSVYQRRVMQPCGCAVL